MYARLAPARDRHAGVIGVASEPVPSEGAAIVCRSMPMSAGAGMARAGRHVGLRVEVCDSLGLGAARTRRRLREDALSCKFPGGRQVYEDTRASAGPIDLCYCD